MTENNHLKAEVTAGGLEMRAVHADLANCRQRNADLFHEAATLESVLSEQKKRHDAEKAELEQEAADLKERLARPAMEYQREGERAINEFLSRHALSEKARKDDEQACYQRLHGEYRAEKTLAHKLEEELEAANRHVACASALGPAAAVEQKCAHKLTMMEFEHEEALKSEISTCRAKVTQAESAYDRVKIEMHSLSASSESIQESLMKRLAHQESEQRLILDAYREDRLIFDAQKRENVELREPLRSALSVRAAVKAGPTLVAFRARGLFPRHPGLGPDRDCA